MTDMTVSKEILRQLGGGRFATITGAHSFVGGDTSLTFHLPKTHGYTKNGTQWVRIALNGLDLYDVTFGKTVKLEPVEISKHENIYNDMLVELFERETGLVTSF